MKSLSDSLYRTPWWALIVGGLLVFVALAAFVTPYHIIDYRQDAATPEEKSAIKREIDNAFADNAIDIGRSVVLSGDTAPSPVVAKYAKGVDLLVHEALSPTLVNLIRAASLKAGNAKRAQIMVDIQNYHTTPGAAAAIARDDKVGALLLNHIVPPLPMKALEGPFLGDARKVYTGPLWIARDGDLISLPAGDRTITRTSLLH